MATDDHLHCQNCSFSHLCMPVSLNQQEMASLDDIIERNRPLQKQDFLIQATMPFEALYAVRSGSFKSYILDQQGQQQITAFHLPGDVIGFDGIQSGAFIGYTQALETSMICEIPFTKLDEMSMRLPALRKQMMSLMSGEIVQDRSQMLTLNQRTAEQRMANFLLSLSDRFAKRGLASCEFHLSMTRSDIGNYLGLSIETVSRLLGRLQKSQAIRVKGKLINLLDPQQLNNIVQSQAVN